MSLPHSLLLPRREGFFSNERIIPPLFFASLPFSLSQRLVHNTPRSMLDIFSLSQIYSLCFSTLLHVHESWCQQLTSMTFLALCLQIGFGQLGGPTRRLEKESRERSRYILPELLPDDPQCVGSFLNTTPIRHPSPIANVSRKWQLLLLCPLRPKGNNGCPAVASPGMRQPPLLVSLTLPTTL